MDIRQAARARAIRAFIELQRRRRAWISFAEIAEVWRNLTGRNAADAQDALRAGLEFGDFRDEVIHLHPSIGGRRMTRARWQNIASVQGWPDGTLWNQYLACCWAQAADVRRWFELQGLHPPATLVGSPAPVPARPGLQGLTTPQAPVARHAKPPRMKPVASATLEREAEAMMDEAGVGSKMDMCEALLARLSASGMSASRRQLRGAIDVVLKRRSDLEERKPPRGRPLRG